MPVARGRFLPGSHSRVVTCSQGHRPETKLSGNATTNNRPYWGKRFSTENQLFALGIAIAACFRVGQGQRDLRGHPGIPQTRAPSGRIAPRSRSLQLATGSLHLGTSRPRAATAHLGP
jgi:hypothetical protein